MAGRGERAIRTTDRAQTHIDGPGRNLDAWEVLISEARLSSCVALVALPPIILLTIFVAGQLGLRVEDGIYFRSFGPLIYIFLFFATAYTLYEFADTLIRRSTYMTYHRGYIQTLHHRSISLDQIKSISIESGIVNSLVFRTFSGETVRIRGYMLQRDLSEVKKTIETLQQAESL